MIVLKDDAATNSHISLDGAESFLKTNSIYTIYSEMNTSGTVGYGQLALYFKTLPQGYKKSGRFENYNRLLNDLIKLPYEL